MSWGPSPPIAKWKNFFSPCCWVVGVEVDGKKRSLLAIQAESVWSERSLGREPSPSMRTLCGSKGSHPAGPTKSDHYSISGSKYLLSKSSVRKATQKEEKNCKLDLSGLVWLQWLWVASPKESRRRPRIRRFMALLSVGNQLKCKRKRKSNIYIYIYICMSIYNNIYIYIYTSTILLQPRFGVPTNKRDRTRVWLIQTQHAAQPILARVCRPLEIRIHAKSETPHTFALVLGDAFLVLGVLTANKRWFLWPNGDTCFVGCVHAYQSYSHINHSTISYKQTSIQTDRQTDRQTDGRTDGQTDRQTDKQHTTKQNKTIKQTFVRRTNSHNPEPNPCGVLSSWLIPTSSVLRKLQGRSASIKWTGSLLCRCSQKGPLKSFILYSPFGV